jgi:hypothetical protein
MQMHDPDELSPAEREELSALPRRRDPDRLLEERTVRALRSRGFLGPARRQVRPWWGAAAAAAIALFAAGFALGQRSAGIAFVESSTASRDQAAMETAMLVQRTGSAWIAALGTLADIAAEGDPDAVRQGRDAARAALHSAALELAAIAPDDPVASRLLWLLAEPAEAVPDQESRALIWF